MALYMSRVNHEYVPPHNTTTTQKHDYLIYVPGRFPIEPEAEPGLGAGGCPVAGVDGGYP